VSTRYHSSGSIWPRASPARSAYRLLSRSLALSLPVSLFSLSLLSLSLLHSLSRFARPPASFSVRSMPQPAASSPVPRSAPDARRAGSSLRPSPSPPVLPPTPRLVLSRQPHRFTFRVPLAVSLDPAGSPPLSLSPSVSTFLHCTRAPGINPSPSRAPYLLSRTGSLVLFSARAPLSLGLPFSAAPLAAGPLSLCARQTRALSGGRGTGGGERG
jgi:hypothetical protein